MTSDRRLQANRANAAKSTGPKTAAGKRNSARNSIRHGMLARTIVLDSESTYRFNSLLSALQQELQPRSGIEHALVETMAVARWRQMRLWAMEQAGLTHEIGQQENAAATQDAVACDAPTRAALAFRALVDQSRTLDLMNRYEARYDRQFGRALDRLLQLREKSVFAERTQSPSSQTTDNARHSDVEPA